MRATLEATVQAYKDWGKRPTEGWHILECGVRDTKGEWGFLDEGAFKEFLALCDQEGFPEMWECRHRWDNSGENIYE